MEGSKGETMAVTTTGGAGITTTRCAICCEKKPNFVALSKCDHGGGCRDCIVQWIEKVESTGQGSIMPGCPFCRVPMTAEEINVILGRPYKPATTSNSNDSNGVMDDLTRQWLEQYTAACLGCGARIQKIDGCDLMECLCGFRFCYGCGSQGAMCECTPRTHYFWNNALNRTAPRAAPQRAPINNETGHVDLREYIQRRRRGEVHPSGDAISDWLSDDEDDSAAWDPSSPATTPECWGDDDPSYSPLSQSGRAMALESTDYPNARRSGQPAAPPPFFLSVNSVSTAASSNLVPLRPSLWSPSPTIDHDHDQYSVTSATFSPLRNCFEEHMDEEDTPMQEVLDTSTGNLMNDDSDQPVVLGVPREKLALLERLGRTQQSIIKTDNDDPPVILPVPRERLEQFLARHSTL